MNHHKYTFLLFIIALTMFNCNEPSSKSSKVKIDYTGFHEVSFDLINNLGKVTMMLPDEFNRFELQTSVGCTRNLTMSYHYFCDSTYGYIIQRGDFLEMKGDSSWSLEVSQSASAYPNDEGFPPQNFRPISFDKELVMMKYSLQYQRLNENYHLLYIDTCLINQRRFSRAVLKDDETKLPTTLIRGTTWIGENLIAFSFNCSAKNQKDFVSRMFKSLISVRIDSQFGEILSYKQR